jgi:hypothetical protein
LPLTLTKRAPNDERGASARPSRRRWLWPSLGVLAIGLLVAILVLRWPDRADGAGAFDECYWGWPVVALDGTSPYLPVMTWPAGYSYDDERHVVLNAAGQTVVSQGDRIVVRGTIRDMSGGDIPPCFVTHGIDLEDIAPA